MIFDEQADAALKEVCLEVAERRQVVETAIGHLKTDHCMDSLLVTGQIDENNTPFGPKECFITACIVSAD